MSESSFSADERQRQLADLMVAYQRGDPLEALPVSTRDPWLLHHAFGFSFEIIAQRLGISAMAAKLRSSRATRALRLALDGGRNHDDE